MRVDRVALAALVAHRRAAAGGAVNEDVVPSRVSLLRVRHGSYS